MSGGSNRVLFLSRWFPYPPGNGSKLRIFNLLKVLAAAHEVMLLSFNDQPDKAADVSGLAAWCAGVDVVPWRGFNPDSRRARLGFFNSTPRSMIDTFSPEMAQCIKRQVSQQAIDVIVASQIDMAAYFPYFGGVPALFEEAEVGTLYEQYAHAQSAGQKLRYGLTWAKHRRYLARVLAQFQACTVVSVPEKALLATAVPHHTPVSIIPNCIDVADYAHVRETAVPHTLIFAGAFTYQPNYDAMVWFLQEVFPLVRAHIPQAHLTITGNHANLPLPSTDNVTLTGFVTDVRPYVARAAASLAPIWTGGGTRLKILEAMALRTPVIATTKGAEGLDVVDGQHMLLADDPHSFATAVCRLLQEPVLRQQLAQNAYDFVSQHYSWPAVAPRFLEVVEQVARAAKKPGYNLSKGG